MYVEMSEKEDEMNATTKYGRPRESNRDQYVLLLCIPMELQKKREKKRERRFARKSKMGAQVYFIYGGVGCCSCDCAHAAVLWKNSFSLSFYLFIYLLKMGYLIRPLMKRKDFKENAEIRYIFRTKIL